MAKIETKGEVLLGDDAAICRALGARANYLVLDRPDVGLAANEFDGMLMLLRNCPS